MASVNYDLLVSKALELIPVGVPIFVRLSTAVNNVASGLLTGPRDQLTPEVVASIDLAASKILAKNLSEIGDVEALEIAFTVLSNNPECIAVLLSSPYLTDAVVQSAMESAAVSPSLKSVQSFELLLNRSRAPNYKKILVEALGVHRHEERRNSLPFIRCVLKHMWPEMPQLSDKGVLGCARAIAGATTEERAAGAVTAYGELQSSYNASSTRASLALQIVRGGISGPKPSRGFGSVLRNTAALLVRAVTRFKEWVTSVFQGGVKHSKSGSDDMGKLMNAIFKAAPNELGASIVNEISAAIKAEPVDINQSRNVRKNEKKWSSLSKPGPTPSNARRLLSR